MTGRSIALFLLAALLEIGGAWLVRQTIEDGRARWLAVAGGALLVAYGVVAAFPPDPDLGRVLAANGGVLVAGSLRWDVVVDGFRPDLAGAAICLVGVGVIMCARG